LLSVYYLLQAGHLNSSITFESTLYTFGITLHKSSLSGESQLGSSLGYLFGHWILFEFYVGGDDCDGSEAVELF
jgi:hypothetical protein